MPNKKIGVFIGDPHFAGSSVGIRLGNYTEAVAEKLTEALEIARDYPADYACILGDLFTHPDPKGEVRNAALNVLAKGNGGEPWPFPIMCVVGNHDISGHTTDTLEQTAIETFNKAGVIDISETVPELDLYQIHYQHGIEKEIFHGDAAIWAIHSYVVPEPIMGEFITIECCSRYGETMVFPRLEMLAATDEILTDNGVRSQGSPDTLAIWNAKPSK